MQAQLCYFCGHTVQLVHVHGHYQCPVCHTNALPCCDGDNCETNFLLSDRSGKEKAIDNGQLTMGNEPSAFAKASADKQAMGNRQ